MTGARVVIYTSPACPYCARAKTLLRERGVPFEERDVAADPEERERMIQASGRRTVPQVFVDGKPVGGYDDLVELDRQGGLATLVESDTGGQS